MEGVWCLPLILTLLSLLLHHDSCTGRQLHDALHKVSPDYLTDRHVGNSKMFRRLFGQTHSTTVENVELVEKRANILRALSVDDLNLERIKKEAESLDGLLKEVEEEEEKEEERITKKVNDLENVGEPCQYMSQKKKSPLKWQNIEVLLMKIEYGVAAMARPSPTLDTLSLRALEFRATKKKLQDRQEKFLAWAEETLKKKNECTIDPKVESAEAKARRQLETVERKAGHVDFLLTLMERKREIIQTKLQFVINEHQNVGKTSNTAKVDLVNSGNRKEEKIGSKQEIVHKLGNALYTQFSTRKPAVVRDLYFKMETIESLLMEMDDDLHHKLRNAYMYFSTAKSDLVVRYVDLERGSKTWQTIESILTEMEDDLSKVKLLPTMVESKRDRVRNFRGRRKQLEDCEAEVLRSVLETMCTDWFLQDMVKQNAKFIGILLEGMAEEREKNAELLRVVKGGKELDAEGRKKLTKYYSLIERVCRFIKSTMEVGFVGETPLHTKSVRRHEEEVASIKKALGVEGGGM